MGFRSTMVTEHFGIKMPRWFVEKYPWLYFGGSNGMVEDDSPHLLISSKREVKFYCEFEKQEVFVDLQKVLIEVEVKKIAVVLLHECAGITLVTVSQDKITGREPLTWKEVTGVEHNYCYGCSEPR